MRKKGLAVWLILVIVVVACSSPNSDRATKEVLETALARLTETAVAAPPATEEPTKPPATETPPPTPTLAALPAAEEPTTAAATGQELLEQVRAAGKLVVSTDPNYAPQSFLNSAGEMDGFDVDVAKQVAQRLGVQLEFVTPDWDLITAGNWEGRWDVSIGSMTPTEDRAEILWFTAPYYYTPASFAVHQDNTTIQTVDDLAGKKVGLGLATTYEAYLRGNLSLMGGVVAYPAPAGIKIWQYVTDAEALDDLELGDGVRVDAVMTSQPTIQADINEGLPIKYVGTPAFYEPLAFALDKARGPADEMLKRLNEIIAEMHADGTLSELSIRWYGIDLTRVVRPEEQP